MLTEIVDLMAGLSGLTMHRITDQVLQVVVVEAQEEEEAISTTCHQAARTQAEVEVEAILRIPSPTAVVVTQASITNKTRTNHNRVVRMVATGRNRTMEDRTISQDLDKADINERVRSSDLLSRIQKIPRLLYCHSIA